MGRYFGTDGIRGEAFVTLDQRFSFRTGYALSYVLEPTEVIIGMDTRESSIMIAYSVANGILARGINVTIAGVVPTPMIAHYSKVKGIIGVMITASHNPYYDNGIKIFNQGYKTTEKEEYRIEEFIDHGDFLSSGLGKLKLLSDVKEEYLKIYEKLDLKPMNLNIGFDSANGANYQIARELFDLINKNSIQIKNNPDGVNINLNCGSTHLEPILQLVKDKALDIAFSFDGDGDRIIVIDQNGRVYDGDLLIYIIGSYLKKKNLLNKDTVVLTKMSNPGLLKALTDQGISYVLTDIGDKHVFDALYMNNYTIGGESSGHIILTHLLHTGDGLLVALYLLQILNELGKSLPELIKDVELYPIKQTNLKNINKTVLLKQNVIDKINEIKEKLGKDSLLLVRPSGTEPLVRITMSSKDEHQINSLTEELINYLKKESL